MITKKGGSKLQVSESIHIKDQAIRIEEIMDTYGTNIYHLVYCYVHDKAIAEDLTQEVFFTAHVKQLSFRQEASLKSWITRIAINKCKDYLRSSYIKRTIVSNLFQPFMKNTAQSPEEVILQQDEAETLSELVLNLPIKYREVILLYYYQDFSILEISSVLKVKEATVKSRLRRGRDRLKLKIEEKDLI
jgi:RNA polymerase sigma-70 factor, ECF subfamily